MSSIYGKKSQVDFVIVCLHVAWKQYHSMPQNYW